MLFITNNYNLEIFIRLQTLKKYLFIKRKQEGPSPERKGAYLCEGDWSRGNVKYHPTLYALQNC